MEKFQQYVIDRLRESSTWRGAVIVATAVGIVPASEAEVIIQIGLAISGAIGMIFSDLKGQ